MSGIDQSIGNYFGVEEVCFDGRIWGTCTMEQYVSKY
jgi:hypothetical protein